MTLSAIRKKASSLFTRIRILLSEKHYHGLPYLYKKNGFDSLLIVFSAFTGEKRRYNYVRSFKHLKCDKLYILDPWGYLGSYNLFENGEDYPMQTTRQLIRKIVDEGVYKRFFTAGSSKGGTCAIFFGLDLGADEIFSGACQYNLGSYLWREEFRGIFHGMMGKDAGQSSVDLLNNIIKDKLRDGNNRRSTVHVLYSKRELTYERQIIDLLHDLVENNISFVEIESDFENHEMVSAPFIEYVNHYLDKLLT